MPGLVFKFEDGNTPRMVGDLLDVAGERTIKLQPVMKLIGFDMMRANAENIQSGGRRGGGSYKNLTELTIIKKGGADILYTEGARPNYTKIGHDALVSSVTIPGAEFQKFNYDANGVSLGTSRPYAGTHQFGNAARKIPRRPFMAYTQHDADRWNSWITAELMKDLVEK